MSRDLKSLTNSINYENFDRPFYKKSKFDGQVKNINFFQNCTVIKKGESKKYFYKDKHKFYFLDKVKKFLSKFYD